MSEGDSNQRVTNAMLKKDLEYLMKGQDEIRTAVQANTEHRISCSQKWQEHDKEHERTGRTNRVWDGATIIAGAISGAITAALKQ